ncbi:DUF3365 domain-containing protein [Thermodesulfobacteriota bacterium]
MGKYIDKYGVRSIYTLICIIIVLFFLWASYDYKKSVRNNLLSEARIISSEMLAVKSYIRNEQSVINTDAQGGYDFKGVHPDLAVRRIASIIEGTTNYTIRQVSLAPRNEENIPDKFESDMLIKLRDNPGILEVYDDDSIGGHKVFRYIVPLRSDNSCVPCHGGEKGTIDITGYKSEGYEVGELIGGLSVIIKSYKKFQLLRQNMSVLLVFIFLVTMFIGLIIYNLKKHFNNRLAEIQNLEKTETVSLSSESYKAALDDKFHKLMMHNLRNPVGEIVDSIEILKDVPLNILLNTVNTSTKLSSYAARLIELKKLEQGRADIMFEDFDFVAAFKSKMKSYEKTAMMSAVRFEGETALTSQMINSDKINLFKAIDYAFLSILKFTRKETGSIKVSLHIDSEINCLQIVLVNNSNRISEASERLILEKFSDIEDENHLIMFNTSVELTISRMMLNRLSCELAFNIDNKEENQFIVTLPMLRRDNRV